MGWGWAGKIHPDDVDRVKTVNWRTALAVREPLEQDVFQER